MKSNTITLSNAGEGLDLALLEAEQAAKAATLS